MKRIKALCIIIIFILLIVSPIPVKSNHENNLLGKLNKYSLPEFQDMSNLSDINFNFKPELKRLNYLKCNFLDWPMIGHDPLHTGRSIFNTTNNLGQNLWRCQIDDQPWCSPVVGMDGTIYIGTGAFNAIKPDGTLLWKFNHTPCWTAAAIDNDGTIYFGTSLGDDHFYALYSNGTVKWKVPCSDIQGCPVIAPDGSIIFGEGYSHNIVALYPNGTKKWEFTTNNVVYSSPAVGPDGTVYCGSHDGNIYALYPNGTLKWSFPTGDWVHGSPSIGSDGTIYCGSDSGYLYALNQANGSMKWHLQIGQSYASPTIDEDGTLYLGVWEKKFYAINSDGTLKWSFDTGGGKVWDCTAALSSDGTLYFCTCDLESHGGIEIIALNVNGTVKWRSPLDTVFSSPAIGKDGTVYIGGDEGGNSYLKAFNKGPLRAEVSGPYFAYDGFPVNSFNGYVFGGIPPYTYEWEFGDGHSSIDQSPSHTYSHTGFYTATFTVTDSIGNQSSDTALVTIAPSVCFLKPIDAIYLLNIPVWLHPHAYSGPVIIGSLTVKVFVLHPRFIDHIDFFLNGNLQKTVTTPPFRWTWAGSNYPRIDTLAIVAYSKSGTNTTESIRVSWYPNLSTFLKAT
jgi:outer membrane protein assembly factor BamB